MGVGQWLVSVDGQRECTPRAGTFDGAEGCPPKGFHSVPGILHLKKFRSLPVVTRIPRRTLLSRRARGRLSDRAIISLSGKDIAIEPLEADLLRMVEDSLEPRIAEYAEDDGDS